MRRFIVFNVICVCYEFLCVSSHLWLGFYTYTRGCRCLHSGWACLWLLFVVVAIVIVVAVVVVAVVYLRACLRV